jgi:hypothetical protein
MIVNTSMSWVTNQHPPKYIKIFNHVNTYKFNYSIELCMD